MKNHKLQYDVNTDELGQIESCEVSLPDDTTYIFSIWFSDYDGCRCDIVKDADSTDYIIEAYDIKATKELIKTFIKELKAKIFISIIKFFCYFIKLMNSTHRNICI